MLLQRLPQGGAACWGCAWCSGQQVLGRGCPGLAPAGRSVCFRQSAAVCQGTKQGQQQSRTPSQILLSQLLGQATLASVRQSSRTSTHLIASPIALTSFQKEETALTCFWASELLQ